MSLITLIRWWWNNSSFNDKMMDTGNGLDVNLWVIMVSY